MRNNGKVIRIALILALLCLGTFAEGAFAVDTYTIVVLRTDKPANGTVTTTIDPASGVAQAGAIITVTINTSSNCGPVSVSFLDDQGGPITIQGCTVTRDYDNPNQFAFVMPAQNVKLHIVCETKPTISVNTFWTPDTGTATPASADGTTSAVAYTCPKVLSSTSGSPIFTSASTIDRYLCKFSDGGDYGTIDTSGTYLVYTPNANAAGKLVTICVKACTGGTVSGEKRLTVQVGAVPGDASQDATLSALSYSVDDGAPVPIALQSGVYDYSITLPLGTGYGVPVALSATPTESNATITGKEDTKTDYIIKTASVTIAAQNPSVRQTYTVNFSVAPPSIPPSVTSGSQTYQDGDTILISLDTALPLKIDHGSGDAGARAFRYEQTSNPAVYSTGGTVSHEGMYPYTSTTLQIRALSHGTTTLTIVFVEKDNGQPPTHTIRLTLATALTPGAPTNLVAKPGDGQIELTWTPPADNGGTDITGYEVSTDGGSTWTPTGSTDPSHTLTGLTNGTPYTVIIRAVNAIGGGAASDSFTTKPRPIDPPQPDPALSMPKTFKATVGFSYPLASTVPSGTVFTTGNKKRATVDANGVVTAKKTGKVTIKAKDESGKVIQSCKVTVVANKFTRKKPLMLKGGNGLYASTKRLYYKNKKLYAEVFVYNRTKASVRGAGPLTFQLRDGDRVIYQQPVPEWNFKNKLKNKRYKVYKLTIKEEMLGGVGAKAFDLGRGEIQALLVGEGITPLTASMENVTKPKSAEALLSIEPIDPSELDLFEMP